MCGPREPACAERPPLRLGLAAPFGCRAGPGGLTSPPWSPRGALGLACPGRMPPQRREWGSEALLEFHQKSCLNPGVMFFSFFLFFFFLNLPQLIVAPVPQPQSSPAHSFPGKCLHREGPSWEIHLTSQHRVWRMGRAKSGPSLCWRLLLPAWEASFRRAPVTPAASPPPVGTPAGIAPSRLVSSYDIPAHSLG